MCLSAVDFFMVTYNVPSNTFFDRSLIKSKVMPALVESEEEEEEDADIKDPLPEKLQNSMVINRPM